METLHHPTASIDEMIHRRRWWILAVLSLSLFLVVVDNTIVNVALPTLAGELSASTSQLQWIVDAYSLVFAGLLLAFGSLGDRYGRKGTLQIGLVLFAGTSLFAAFASSAGQLVAARAAMGVGAALVFPATLAILTNVFIDPAERAKAIGIWSGTVGLAVALGPITGGWLIEQFWWGSVFVVNVPIVGIALLAGWRLLPSSRDPDAGRLDPLGLVSSVLAISLLVYTVIEAPHNGWGSARTVGGLVLAVALLAAFVMWERRRHDPMLDVRIFRNKRFSAASVAIAVAFFGLFGFIFLITQYFQIVLGYSALSAGLHTLPFAVAAAIAAPISARLALAFGAKVVVACGLGCMAVGFAIATTFDADTAYWGPIAATLVLLAVGLGLTTTPATEAIMGSLPRERAGIGSAINDSTRELGGTFGVAVVGSVFSSVYAPKLRDVLGGISLPDSAKEAATESVVAAAGVAGEAPPAIGQQVLAAAQGAFLDGLTAATRVTALAAIVGTAVAVAFLPGRIRRPAPIVADEPTHDAAPSDVMAPSVVD